MSFWNLSDGSKAESTGSYEVSSNEPIPDGTVLIALITEAKYDVNPNTNVEHIKLRWDVVDGKYKNRVIFQKIRINESDSAKRDKQIRMLAAIDANCGGKLMALGREPTDIELAVNLCNKPMQIRVRVWEIENGKGNWVEAVGVKQSATPKQPEINFNPDEDIPM